MAEAIECASKSDGKPSSGEEGEGKALPTSSSAVEEDQKQKEQVIKMTVSSLGEISTNTTVVDKGSVYNTVHISGCGFN